MSRRTLTLGLLIATLCVVIRPSEHHGGFTCLDCHLVVAIIEQYSEMKNISIVETLEILCSFLPDKFEDYCRQALKLTGPILIKLQWMRPQDFTEGQCLLWLNSQIHEWKFLKHLAHLNNEIVAHAEPYVVCHALHFCHTEPGQPICRGILPPSSKEMTTEEFNIKLQDARTLVNDMLKKNDWELDMDICKLPGIKEVCDLLKSVKTSHKPAFDLDGDGFSPVFMLRGSAWRGRDCNDTNSSTHPGAKPINGDADSDSNCNGIYGVNPHTGRTYEEELCDDYQPKGVAVLGDSISAHFHLPTQWVDPQLISKKAFLPLLTVIQNEADWPMLSSITGHGTNKWPDVISGEVDSVYLKLRKRNRCNHRDYQNIAINGENSFKMRESVKTLSRNIKSDRPLVVFYALAGNDVCSSDEGKRTTPEEMHSNTIQVLDYLATILPNNSHVLLAGLTDGRVIYDSMATRIHPATSYWKTFTYSQFYDFLNCLQIGPCSGWMNTNKTIRDYTSQKATELNKVLLNISKTHKGRYSNYKLLFLPDPLSEVLKAWTKMGGELWQFLEAVDSLHTNQYAHAFAAHIFWKMALTLDPDIFGPKNPHNKIIENLFGDQGGY